MERTEKILLGFSIGEAVNATIQWVQQISALGLSTYQWIGILWGIFAGLLIAFVVRRTRPQKHGSKASDKLANIKSGDTVKGQVISISRLFDNRDGYIVDGITFRQCTLKGPGIVAVRGETRLSYCSIWRHGGELKDYLILAEKNRTYRGIGILVNCTFEHCRFENFTWLVPTQAIYDDFLKILRIS